MAKYYNCKLPKPDSQGRYRPVVGKNREGKPVKFQVGTVRTTTTAEAQRRLDSIRLLYQKQCEYLGIAYWGAGYHQWAIQLSGGTINSNFSRFDLRSQNGTIQASGSEFSKINSGQAAEELSGIHQLIEWGLPVQIVDCQLQASGNAFIKEQIEIEVNRAVRAIVEQMGTTWGEGIIESAKNEAIPANVMDAEIKTLHEALTAFSKNLQINGITHRLHNRLARIKYLKEHTEDFPLWRFDFPQIEKIVAYWRNRPVTQKGNRCSKDHAADMLKEFFSFMSWMDTEPNYKWEKPKGIEKINRTPITLPEDNNVEAFQTIKKRTYTPEELAILAANTNNFGRALIGVCVNCAFGASEVGQLSMSGYSLSHAHPHAEKLGIVSTDADSWIVGNRPKTGVYGEHLLWRAVAKAVAPYLDGRPVLPMTSKETTWFRVHAKNPQTAFANWWYDLLDRVEKEHPDFPRLPFGSLRDLLPNVLRQKYSDQIADMALQHGDPAEHNLLKCYANTPFGKLVTATRELEPMFKPFLSVIGELK